MAKCNAICTIHNSGAANIQVRCELPHDHIGRHQFRFKQKTKERNWIVVLWDADEREQS